MSNILDTLDEREAGIFGLAMTLGYAMGAGLTTYAKKNALQTLLNAIGKGGKVNVSDEEFNIAMDGIALNTLLRILIECDAESADKVKITQALSKWQWATEKFQAENKK